MRIVIGADRTINLSQLGENNSVSTRQEIKVRVDLDASLKDNATTQVALVLKSAKHATFTAASTVLNRVDGGQFEGWLALTSSIILGLAEGDSVPLECHWLLDGHQQRSQETQVRITQAVTTGSEGAPPTDQSQADRQAWLLANLQAGAGLEIVAGDPGKVRFQLVTAPSAVSLDIVDGALIATKGSTSILIPGFPHNP